MSTTRHLVNRRRRLATVAAERAATATIAPQRGPKDPDPSRGEPVRTPDGPDATADDEATDTPDDEEAAGKGKVPKRERVPRLRIRLPAVLGVLTVLLGAYAAWAFASAGDLRDDPARQNTALTDIGRTSEVKGQISEAVGAVFSYDYASPAKSEQAVKSYLTGKAVRQHRDMLAQVRAQGQKQKLVLTTTVTDSGVERLNGDRARLLIYADQSNTRTGKAEETTYAAAMFAVDAVRRGDTWRISAIDTFTR
jgi:Mce-associated membrane protein